MANPATRQLNTLEQRVAELVRRFREERGGVAGLEARVRELEAELDRVSNENEKLRRKLNTGTKDLDDVYLRARERLRGRVSSLLARLEVL